MIIISIVIYMNMYIIYMIFIIYDDNNIKYQILNIIFDDNQVVGIQHTSFFIFKVLIKVKKI